jgi:hypothetical protein
MRNGYRYHQFTIKCIRTTGWSVFVFPDRTICFNQQGIDEVAPSTIGPIVGQRAGTFSAVVSDQISGCTISSSFGLSDATFTASALAQPPNCDPVTVRVTTVGADLHFRCNTQLQTMEQDKLLDQQLATCRV